MKKQKILIISIILIVVILGIFEVFWLKQAPNRYRSEVKYNQQLEKKAVKKQEKQQQAQESVLKQKQAKITSYINSNDLQMSVSYYNLNEKLGFSINGDNLYDSKMLLNLPLALEYGKKVNDGQINLVQQIAGKSLNNQLDTLLQEEPNKLNKALISEFGGENRLIDAVSKDYKEVIVKRDNSYAVSAKQLLQFMYILSLHQGEKGYQIIIDKLKAKEETGLVVTGSKDNYIIYQQKNSKVIAVSAYYQGENPYVLAILLENNDQASDVNKLLAEIGNILKK